MYLSILLLIFSLLSFSTLQAQTPDPKFDDYLASVRELLPVDGTLLYDCSVMTGYQFHTHGTNSLDVFNVEDDEIPFSQAWRVTLNEVGDNWWDTGFITPSNNSAIEEGDMLFWVFYARTNEVDELIGLAKGVFAAQITEPPYTNIVQSHAYPQTGWTRFYVYTEAPADYETGRLKANMHFDFFPQIIEFGGFIALNLGQGIDPADLPANEAMIDPKFDDYLASVRELLPVDGTLLYNCASLSGYNYFGNQPDNTFSMISIEDDDLPFEKAFRINTSNFSENLGEQLWFPRNDLPVLQGDMAFFVFYVRSIIPQQETGMVALHVAAGIDAHIWTEVSSLSLGTPDSEWTRYYFFGIAPIDIDAGNLRITFSLSHSAQTIDIGGFIALNLGQGIDPLDLPYTSITYPGQEEDALWRAPAAERIEEHRKGDLLIQVVDELDEPVVDAEVSVEMKRHAFEFGTAPAWNFYSWTGTNGINYREKLLSLFNAASTPFFIGNDSFGWYAQPDTYRLGCMAMAAWLQENNKIINGQTLIYPGWLYVPSLFSDLADDPEAFSNAFIHHLDTVVPIGRDFGVAYWDVINEASWHHEVLDILGDEVIIDWFEHTHALHPQAKLAINEAGILAGGGTVHGQENLQYLISMLQDANAPIHRIGFQSHMGSYLTPPDSVFEILERFAAHGLEIYISEFDANLDDEQTQADYTRDFMTIIFSHPSVTNFTTWGFWEQTMYTPKGAMFRTDWTEKPNYFAYTDLVFNQWWTEEEGLSDENGEFFVRGFLGDYEITVLKDGLISTLDTVLVKEGTNVTLVLAEPPVTYNLDLIVNPPGTGAVNGAGEYEAGAQVTITAAADPDWVFVNWTGDTDHIDHADSALAIVSMPASDVSLTANFEYTGIVLTLNVDMRRANDFSPDEDVLHVTGSMLDWAIPGTQPDNQLMTRAGETMIWHKTFSLEEGEYEYKYFLNSGWNHGEWSGDPNRIIYVEDDYTLYNAWGMMGEAYPVIFSVKDENDDAIDDAVITVNSFTYNAGEYETGYLPAGHYDYHVHHNDYEEATGHFSISNEAVWVIVVMTADDTTIQDMEDFDVKVFPNPVQNTLFVEANMMITDIYIIDMFGRLLISVKVHDMKNELDLSSDHSGMYFIRVFTDRGVKTMRVMVVD